MGYIKEPEGIDFIIESKPLTVEEDKAISEYIRADKAKLTGSQPVVRKTMTKQGLFALRSAERPRSVGLKASVHACDTTNYSKITKEY